MNEDYVRLTIGMDAYLKRRLRKCAADVDMNMSAFIHIILEAVVNPSQLAVKNYIEVRDKLLGNKQP